MYIYSQRIFSFCETAESKNKIHAFDATLVRGCGKYEKLVDLYIMKSIVMFRRRGVKSVQSALSDLLTTSATHGTFSRPSTKHGLILIGLELNTNARESFEHR